MSGTRQSRVRCRRIEPGDIDALVDLLSAGFPRKTSGHWRRAFAILSNRSVPEGLPPYGYMLEADGAAVGVLLLICTPGRDDPASIKCNVSSWYVDPAFRLYGSMLNLAAIKHQPVTYVNVSPAVETWAVIERQGFSRFAAGTFAAVPALGPPIRGARVSQFLDRTANAADGWPTLSPCEIDMLRDHASYGCLTLVCAEPGGSHPFVFRRRIVGGGLLPCAQLIFSRSIDDFVRFAGPVGRLLLRRGMPLVLLPANGPIEGLRGRYYPDRVPMYYKGLVTPVTTDLSYTEAALFGN